MGEWANLPESRAPRALTGYVKAHYFHIEWVKRQTLRSRRIDAETRARLKALGERICDSGVLTQELKVREKFAVVFVVNSLFHEGHPGAGKVKDYVQRTIVAYHSREVRMKHIVNGDHAGTYEIRCGIWTTHLPESLVRKGKLERPGRPSVASVFRKLLGKLRAR